ncbi:phytanoyl-CoA dioxygenase family protein [Streptomyces sp. NPDC058459]|uniref:phytanoyl-CoA dioxygenase family protein n=1 Tax=Streptomyces sp. NPDC058459 TaxID=3346508 RepID=UPI003655EA92
MSARLLSTQQCTELDEAGYTVIEGVLSDAECDLWSETIDSIWLGERGKIHQYAEEPGVQFVDNLLRFSPLFQKAAVEPVVLEAARRVLGPEIILNLMNARRSDSGSGLQPLHDLDRRRGRPFLTCNTIWCLDEFNKANGATRALPGSHLTGEPFLSRMIDPLEPHPDEIRITAPRGAVVIFNAHLLHAGGQNETDRPRRSVQSQFALPTQQPFYDWKELPTHIVDTISPEARKLLVLN